MVTLPMEGGGVEGNPPPEGAMEEPIRSQGSFIDCSRLYMAQGVLAGHRSVETFENKLIIVNLNFQMEGWRGSDQAPDHTEAISGPSLSQCALQTGRSP